MGINAGYFGDDFNFEDRFFPDPTALVEEVERLKAQRLQIVLTMGSFDMLHIGHCRYLREAKKLGHVLIVGVETDAKVQGRKGPRRPVVPEGERYEMLAHTRYVDILTTKDQSHPKWHLIKLLKPHVLQAVEGTYTDEEIVELNEFLKPFGGQVVVQARQAETSTSAKIRLLVIGGMHDLATRLAELLPSVVCEFFAQHMNQMTDSLRGILPQVVNQTVEEMKDKAA